MRRTHLIVVLTSLILGIAGVGSASAADATCVGNHPLCPAGATQLSGTSTNLRNALEDAEGTVTDEQIFLGDGNYQACGGAFSINKPSGDFELFGAGPDTRITWCSGSDTTFEASLQDKDSGVSGVTFVGVNPMTGGNAFVEMRHGHLRNVSIEFTNQAALSQRPALNLIDAELSNSTVSSNDNYSISIDTGGSTKVVDSRIDGRGAGTYGVYNHHNSVELTRVKTTGEQYHYYGDTGSAVTISDSLIDLGNRNNAGGVLVFSNGTTPTTAIVSRTTVVGSAQEQRGLSVMTSGITGTIAAISGIDSIIELRHATAKSLSCNRQNPSPSATLGQIWLNSVAYDSTKRNLQDGSGETCDSGGHFVDSDVDYHTESTPIKFVDFAGGDYHQTWDSPFLNSGATAVAAGSKDLDGNARLVRSPQVSPGDPTRVDIGAYEYQASAPVVTISAPGTGTPGAGIALSASGSDADPGETSQLAYSWTFSDGGSASGPAVTHAFAAGTATATAVATDPAGVKGTATATIRVAPLVKVTQKPKKSFKRGKKGFAVSSKGTIALTFTGATQAKLTLQSVGKKKKLKSVKGSQTLKLKKSKVKLAFGGSFNKKKLKAGKYRLTITPLAADGTTGPPKTVDLKVK